MFSMKNFWPFTVLLFSWISEVHLRNYIPRFETTQLIQVQKGQYVEISFEIWTYASGTPCVDEEYLEIRDGYNQSANLLGVFCGNGTTGIRRSSGRNLWLKFSSSDGYWFQNNSYYSGKELNETTTPNLKLVPKTQFVLFKHSSSLWCPAEGGPAPYIVWRKNGAVVQNSTSVRYWLTITEEEENPNYSCEVETHNGLDQKNISLVIERCPEPCQCTVLEGNIEGFISVNCERKLLHSVPQNLPGTTIKLVVSENQLEDLPPRVFSGLNWLSTLDLSNNHLKDFPPGVFDETRHLTRIWLGNNNFKELPEDLFVGQDRIRFLRMKGNQLQQLPRNIFKDLSNIEELDLSYNKLQTLPEGFLNHSTRLRELRLSGNQLKELPRNIFKHLPDLEELDLSYNQLQKLPRDVLSNNVKLKKLFLSNNKLRHLPSFRNLSQLAILYTSNNSLSTLASDQFQGLSNLRDLAVYNNKIQYLPPRVFEGAKNLLSMYFHNNEMRELPEGFFSNMKDLTTSTVDTNLMCCHLTKEDADCDFVYVDSFANCESMFRNPAPRKCIWVIGILSLVGAVFVIVWRLMFKEKKKKNKIQSIMLMHLAGSDGLMGVYLIIVGVMDAIWSGQYFLHDFPWRSSLSCQITGAIALLSCEVSVMLIAMLSADRVKNIVFPYRGQEKGIEMNVMEEVQNQEDVESDDSDEKSEDERSDHQQQAKPGDHGEPAEQQEGETGGQEQPKEDHDGHEEKKDKPDQQGTKGDHEESEQQHVETDLRKPKVDPKECKEQKVEPVKRKGQKEDHGKPEEQQVKLGQEKASKGGSKEKTEEDTDDEPLEHELLIVDKEQDRQDDNISEGSG
ncbi:Relaxin receptor 1 [Stylophora pistillata]|uniref:Relaxin receptor 1 n=1 Tax=Stylophora pistillata TaxID=50429 RepID=A0A2B4S485_STYPI|nr:Relaxin receptor 1 [Stylophora pistillata]